MNVKSTNEEVLINHRMLRACSEKHLEKDVSAVQTFQRHLKHSSWVSSFSVLS